MNEIIEPLILHEDAFFEYFIPYRHAKTKNNCWGELGIETYGEDLELVFSLDTNYVWTVVDDGDGRDQWIIPEIHLVNRVCYLVTEIPHNHLDIQFRSPYNCGSLTPLGIKRQINKIERAFEKIKSPII